MNAYQEKWIGLFQGAHIPNWQVKAKGDDVEIQVPADVDLKILRDNFPKLLQQCHWILRYRKNA